MTTYVDLVEVERGGLVESVHQGAIAMIDADGAVTSLGDAERTMYPRSTSKLFQAAAMLDLGLYVHPKMLALVAASHSGGDEHVQGVQALLGMFGLDEAHLQCAIGAPIGVAERKKYLSAGGEKNRIRTDCSGKHAGMLATCVINGWPVDSYLAPDHPLQIEIARTVSAVSGDPIEYVTADGCGAPLFSITLAGLARGYRLATQSAGSLRIVADAMREYPEMVAGPGREPTVVMQAVPGVLAKDGAEAVFALADDQGRACAIKIADGSKRALATVVAAVLESWGADPAALTDLPYGQVLGGGVPVGECRLSSEARAYIC